MSRRDLMGYSWLIEHFGLRGTRPPTLSFRAATPRKEHDRQALQTSQYLLQRYWPGADPLDHVAFALRYDGVHLETLARAFGHIPPDAVEARVSASPTGSYSRRIACLYELLTGQELTPPADLGGNYVELLPPASYVTGPDRRIRRWRVNNNLLGNARWCPTVRRVPELESWEGFQLRERMEALRDECPPELFQRATGYAYLEETQASFAIEHERPTRDREEAFVALLAQAGTAAAAKVMGEERLTDLQHAIVDPRFCDPGFRRQPGVDGQVYLGGEDSWGRLRVEYLPPAGPQVPGLMEGLSAFVLESRHVVHPVIRAALASFGFVYIHPFKDGNGRIHRFLLHDVLAGDGFVPPGMVLPISAVMLRHQAEYAEALKAYSRPVNRLAHAQEVPGTGLVEHLNPAAVDPAYRYPDLTRQVLYLFNAAEQSFKDDLVRELGFLRRFDEAKRRIKQVVDLPESQANLLIRLLHQNGGRLSEAKRRSRFQVLDDDEVAAIEAVYADSFEG